MLRRNLMERCPRKNDMLLYYAIASRNFPHADYVGSGTSCAVVAKEQTTKKLTLLSGENLPLHALLGQPLKNIFSTRQAEAFIRLMPRKKGRSLHGI